MEQSATQDSQYQPFDIRVYDGHMVLEGDLDESQDVYRKLDEKLREAAQSGYSKWTIHAEHLRVFPGADLVWIKLVHEHLMRCELSYLLSDLGILVRYAGKYHHPASRFEL